MRRLSELPVPEISEELVDYLESLVWHAAPDADGDTADLISHAAQVALVKRLVALRRQAEEEQEESGVTVRQNRQTGAIRHSMIVPTK